MGKKTLEIFAENLRRNCGPGHKFETITDLGARAVVGTSTIDRLKKGQVAVRLNTLEAIANAYGVPAWQVLVPEFDEKNPPKLYGEGLTAKERELLDVFAKLTGPEKDGLIATARGIRDAREMRNDDVHSHGNIPIETKDFAGSPQKHKKKETT